LSVDPGAASASVGLASVARRRGRSARARSLLEEALQQEPDSVDARVDLADLSLEEGDAAGARALLEQALARDPGRPDAHELLWRVTGMAPRGAAPPEEILRRADAHPYDPRAALAAARLLLQRGRRDEAKRRLERSWWLAENDPRSGLQAARLLLELGGVEGGRAVAVHCFADESVRRDPTWRMRLRLVWVALSATLEPLLDTLFVPVSTQAFSTRGADERLVAIDAAFRGSAGALPATGILAAFTERAPPRRPGEWRLGQAEFLGRSLVVRLDPGALASRTLVHEVLHLYGGVHIAPDVDSLMNPSGDSLELDAANARIVRLLRERRFGPGGIERNALPFVDPELLIAAYAAALRQNLASRSLGLAEALEARRSSRFVAADLARRAAALDEHLGNVCEFAGRLLAHEERYAAAASFVETAARLYGPRTRKGRDARELAERLRRRAELSPAPNPP
jgi:tetratricopeptide (TPR) repeat protein